MKRSMSGRALQRLGAMLLPALLTAILAAGPAGAQITAPAPTNGSALEVRVSLFLVDLLRVLDAEQAVEADLLFRVEWQDGRLAGKGLGKRTIGLDSVWAPRLQPLAPRGLSELMPTVVQVDEDGHMSYAQRLVGKFGAPTDLRDFPFDEHTVRFAFVIPNPQNLELNLVPGPIVGKSKELTIPDWTVAGGELDLSPITPIEALPPIPGASFAVTVRRNSAHYLTKMILPLIVIVMLSWTVFWAPPQQISVQFGFASTSILSVIAYRFALASQLPPVPYGTRLDAFLNGAFFMAAVALVEVVVSAQLLAKDRPSVAHRLDVVCRVVFPILLLLLLGYSFLI